MTTPARKAPTGSTPKYTLTPKILQRPEPLVNQPFAATNSKIPGKASAESKRAHHKPPPLALDTTNTTTAAATATATSSSSSSTPARPLLMRRQFPPYLPAFWRQEHDIFLAFTDVYVTNNLSELARRFRRAFRQDLAREDAPPDRYLLAKRLLCLDADVECPYFALERSKVERLFGWAR